VTITRPKTPSNNKITELQRIFWIFEQRERRNFSARQHHRSSRQESFLSMGRQPKLSRLLLITTLSIVLLLIFFKLDVLKLSISTSTKLPIIIQMISSSYNSFEEKSLQEMSGWVDENDIFQVCFIFILVVFVGIKALLITHLVFSNLIV
jgi:hypothetical protein